MNDKYLIKHGLVYYARFKVPNHLRPFFGKQEIWWSLKTGSHRTAREHITRHRQIFQC